MRCNPFLHAGVRYVEYFTIIAGLSVCALAGLEVCTLAGFPPCGFTDKPVCMLALLPVCLFACKRVCWFACKPVAVSRSDGEAGEVISLFGVERGGLLSSCVRMS